MKASEILRSPDFDYRDDFDVLSWEALVQVVEAAELLLKEGREAVAPEYPNTLQSYWASHRALTALEEYLGAWHPGKDGK